MWELIKAGGWLMAPIIVCSVITLVIILERGVRLRRAANAPNQLAETLIERLNRGRLDQVYLQQVHYSSPLGDILATGIMHAQSGLELMTMHMQSRASAHIHHLEKNLNLLGTIGNIAPLLGLLGTVLGIIESFLAVGTDGMSDPALMAAGISQALITTAAGMAVAIPAMTAYRYYQRKVLDLSVEMEEQATLLTQALLGSGRTHAAPVNRQPFDAVPELS